MITPWMIYWITRLKAFLALSGSVLFVIACTLVIVGLYWMSQYPLSDDESTAMRKVLKTCLVASVVPLIVVTLVPSQKEMAAILVIPRVANSETVQELGDGLVTLAREWMQDLRPKKKEGGAE